MNRAICVAVILSLVLASCNTTKFTMHDFSLLPTQVVKLVNADSIQRTAANAVRLSGPSMVGLRGQRYTELLFSTEIIRSTAEPIVVQFRTTPFDDSVHKYRGVMLVLSADSTTLFNGPDTTTYYTPLPIGKPFLFEVRQDASWFDLVIHHTRLGHQRTALPLTEWVLIGLPRRGSILVGDPEFNF
ncbi:MAG: hypothetical protein RLZZ273_1556 [Bacteroidota bacterium]